MDSNLPQYDEWNKKKKKLQLSDFFAKIYFREGDIWWCALGLNIGTESLGKGADFRRPILVIKKLSGDACIALPLTSKRKEGSWFLDVSIGGEIKYVMLYQIRMVHKKRFQRKIGQLDERDMKRVKEKLKDMLELSNHHPAEARIDGNSPKVDTI